jgi:hypothetical protein
MFLNLSYTGFLTRGAGLAYKNCREKTRAFCPLPPPYQNFYFFFFFFGYIFFFFFFFGLYFLFCFFFGLYLKPLNILKLGKQTLSLNIFLDNILIQPIFFIISLHLIILFANQTKLCDSNLAMTRSP